MNEEKLKQDIVEIGRRLYHKGFVAANDGNISALLSDNEILITPTNVSKGYMSPDDLVKVNLQGEVLSGNLKPSSELKMHLAVYHQRPDVKGIVHAHPPKTTAFAVSGHPIDKITLPEVIFSIGKIAMVEYATPSTDEVPQAICKKVLDSDAFILANHGALTVGIDLFKAYFKMETLEHFAEISIYAKLLGRENSLNEEQIKTLLEIRHKTFG